MARRLRLITLLVLTAALTVLGSHAFRQKLLSFQPLGFQPARSGGQWSVRSVDDDATGLEKGDRIVLVNGVESGRISELRRLLSAEPQAQVVVLRGDELQTVAYARPALDLDVPWLALSLLGLIYLAIGLYTLWRTEDGALFYLWCLTSAALYVFSPVLPVDSIGKWVFVVDEAARLLLPPLTLHLFLSIPSRSRSVSRWLPALYLPAAALLAVQLDLALAGGQWIAGGASSALLLALDRIELLHLLAFAAGAVAVLAWRLRQTTEWEQHRQILWLVVGTAGGYLPFALLYGLPSVAGLRPGELFTTAAVLPLVAVPLAFGWAILRYRLWDLGLMVRNGMSHAITLLLAVGTFSLLDLALRRALPGDFSFARDLITVLGGVAIVGLVVPTHRRVQGALERLQYGARFRHRRGLARLGQELLRERDLDRLCEILLEELERGLDLDRTNLLLVQGDRLLPFRPEAGFREPAPLNLVGDESWEERFETLSGVSLPSAPRRMEQVLFRAGYRYVFPLVVRDTRVGLVVTGLRGGDLPLDSEDIDLVRVLLDQAALAIENARLLDQVHRQLEEVVALKQHSEGILESSPAGIAVLDGSDAIVSANLAFATLAGRARPDVLGRRLGDVLPIGEIPGPGEPAIQSACRDGLGRERHLEVGVAPLRGDSDPDRRVVVFQDVTERVEMESILKEQDRLASLGVLAAGVAHEVNTPLTGISSYAQLLLAETGPDDPRRALLEKVERQTFRASRIVSNLLDFARKPGVERKSIEIHGLLTDTGDLLRERFSTRGIRYELVSADEPIRILGSEGELQQVFTNLLLNAVDAMEEVGSRVTIRTRVEDDRLRVEIDDDGPGVPASAREAIFQPFFTTKRGKGGTGLGLTICQSIVEQHGGRITFRNLEPRGCRFTVELPLASEGEKPSAE